MKSKNVFKRSAISCVVMASLSGPVLSQDVVYPDPYWVSDTPESHGFDSAALENLKTYAQSINSDSLLIIKDGYIILEEYWDGGNQNTQRQAWSVTKSFTGLISGIAADQGLIATTDRASDAVTEWQGTDSEPVVVDQLLRNTSGRYADCNTDTFPFSYLETGGQYPSRPDLTQYAIDQPKVRWGKKKQQHEPGTVWGYNNMAIQTLDRVISIAAGMTTKSFAEQSLLAPLEMNATTIGTDREGHMVMAAGITSSARDLARIGYLTLNNGQWKDQQVVSEAYISNMLSPGVNPLNNAYGYLWWLNTEEGEEWNNPAVESDVKCVSGQPQFTQRYPDAPLDLYLAAGNKGQYIIVSPSENLVIVRQGNTASEEVWVNNLYKETAAAMLP